MDKGDQGSPKDTGDRVKISGRSPQHQPSAPRLPGTRAESPEESDRPPMGTQGEVGGKKQENTRGTAGVPPRQSEVRAAYWTEDHISNFVIPAPPHLYYSKIGFGFSYLCTNKNVKNLIGLVDTN